MSKRFLFSTKANLATQSVLKGLSQARLAMVITYALVITEDDRVAALLEQLDTAEEIVGLEAVKDARESKRKPRKERAEGTDRNPKPQSSEMQLAPKYKNGKR